MSKKLFPMLILFTLILITPIKVLARIYIPIDQPIDKKFPIAVADLGKLERGGGRSARRKIADIIKNDLELTGYFAVISKRAYKDRDNDAIAASEIDFKKWTTIGARALVKGAIGRIEGKTVVQLKLFDPVDMEMLVGKEYRFEYRDIRKIAHKFADEIMLALTGIRGVFGTKIAYVQEKKKGDMSIYVMDMDGENVERITRDRSLNLGPSWSPDGSKLVYASYLNGFPDIYMVDLESGKREQLTRNRSTNITPAWSPTGFWIAYASSFAGNMEIYLMNPEGGNLRKMTNSFGIDISPQFSPEGNAIVYGSERGGNVHVYKQSLSAGGKPERLTFMGSHNTSPDWSPDGQKVVFCGRVGGKYDVYTVNIDGTDPQRLTISYGTNEHPRWSPDGRFITFSSTRNGDPEIYMMRFDGAHQIKLNKKGNGMMPEWGPWGD